MRESLYTACDKYFSKAIKIRGMPYKSSRINRNAKLNLRSHELATKVGANSAGKITY